MAVDLTGAWRADDGGLYYVRQLADRSVTWAGLQDSGFHKGVGFTNVFRGHVSPDGKRVTGNWADVPRGRTLGAGTLALDIVGPTQLRKRPAGTTGSFGGSVWTKGAPQLVPQDIQSVESRVQRYDVKLAENNPPCRDFTVMWGTVGAVKGPTVPPVRDDYCSFVGDWPGDGDFTFDLVPDFTPMEPDFWTSGWLGRSFTFGQVLLGANEFMLALLDRFGHFHCEAPMYARENDSDHCRDAPVMLLPGWHERGGNSILVNGRPVDDDVGVVTDHRQRPGSPVPPPFVTLVFHGRAGGGELVNLTTGTVARVTGVVADDAGHSSVPPEIHPVYAIDVVSVPRRKVGLPLPGLNLTGAWHGSDIGTYYVRQVETTVWWLGLSRDQGRSFANVFHGTISGNVVEGTWADVPMGVGGALSGGTLTLHGGPLSTQLVRLAQSGAFGGSLWTKLYDVEPGVPVKTIP